ncbi:nucleotidyltransferase [Lacticaseibacillus baoqingensis]|uniref:tRNA(Met) cytidine acetate ligase n=1 Tax=Lacticaseibacillus baoqingensis TaxID=2486013 RepID=A0ABW4E2J8_9LACO|nr:nucleotidyltransferase [Lacticaseibacillus baoqingensis]
MQAVAMIAEFNPLHNGHVHALAQAKRASGADVVVVALAGNYVQRGEPAIVDKWARAKAALTAGADVVVELPTACANQAAPGFAAGGVGLLAALGVQTLAFGTEAPQLDYMQAASQLAALPPATAHLKDFTQTYATQLNRYYQASVGIDMSAPNLLLGMSYAQANLALGAPLQLLPIARVGVDHDACGSVDTFASASQIRQLIQKDADVQAFVPTATRIALNARHQSWQDLFPWLKYRLQTADLGALREIDAMAEGLEYRLTQNIDAAGDFSQFMAAIKSKRYTYARLRRLCLAVVLNQTQALVAAAKTQPYIHVLGFTHAGQAYLHAVKKTVAWPLITKVSAAMLMPGGCLYWQQRADRLIETLTGQTQNYGRPPIMI